MPAIIEGAGNRPQLTEISILIYLDGYYDFFDTPIDQKLVAAFSQKSCATR